MFSYFRNGISDIIPERTIDISSYVSELKNNPNYELIQEIRILRENGDDSYKELKRKLPYFTPNCIVKERRLTGDAGHNNFIFSSTYIYFDFDGVDDVEGYKTYFIEKYGHVASLISHSCSMGGLSVLFKVKNEITLDNFDLAWNEIRTTILADEIVDKNCKDIGRANFISYDPDVYFNFENQIELSLNEVGLDKTSNKGATCSKTKNLDNYNSSCTLKSIDIKQVLNNLIFETIVPVNNPILDFKPVEYVSVFAPKAINDNYKHSTYSAIIHALVHLNPNADKNYIFGYINYLNENIAKPKMEYRELIRSFNFYYQLATQEDQPDPPKRIKRVHFQKECGLSRYGMICIANKINGYWKKNNSINQIINARYLLEQSHEKITQKNVAELIGKSLRTVKTYWHDEPININNEVEAINNNHGLTLNSDDSPNSCWSEWDETALLGDHFLKTYSTTTLVEENDKEDELSLAIAKMYKENGVEYNGFLF